jgi:DNA-3-methyladenine glycosylase I
MLKKRQVFREAFDDWDIKKIAGYDGYEVDRLIKTEGMIRNFQKINAVINNAKRYVEIQDGFGTASDYLWSFVDNQPIPRNHISRPGELSARNLSLDLRKRGFQFAGEATAVGVMQDTEMINDHDISCFCYKIA